tara:strand:- start:933 stop:1115 length:183 start_codon:yes stop_codon:yes gene_type:complete
MKHSNNKLHQIYTDLEEEYNEEKNYLLKLKIIEVLVKKYPNDADLGEEVRKLINSKKIER